MHGSAARSLFLPGMLFLLATVSAQDAHEQARAYCNPEDPRNQCPGQRCFCTEDTLEITFDGDSQSVLELDEFVPNTAIEMTVVMDVHSGDPAIPGSGVQGWAYGVAHDGAMLELLRGDTPFLEQECCFGFQMRNIQTCDRVADPTCRNPTAGGGFISAVILSFTQARSLPQGRSSVARAEYLLRQDPGPAGTLIQVVDYLKCVGSPPADINITVNGISRRPRLLVDGHIRRAAGRFGRGDVDGNGRISIADSIQLLYTAAGIFKPGVDCQDVFDAGDDGRLTLADGVTLLRYLFQRGPGPPSPFPDCGGDPTPDTLPCAESSCS